MTQDDRGRPRTAVVTGGASGIGEATVELLRSRGWEVAVIDRAFGSAEAAPPPGGFAADVSDWGSVRGAMEAAAGHLGGIDVLVASAGVARRGTIEDTTPEVWDEVFAVNVRGVYLAARAAMPFLREGRDPAIVTVASQLGIVANAANAAYCASKGAVIQLTRAMAIDAIAEGIRVNAVCPGATMTPMTAAFYSGGGDRADQERQLLGRLIDPVEIAGAIAYLACAEARATVGEILVVDGGYVIH
jgi:2-keto-3-deoxy-L-fuconate dehydrogenase